MKNSWITLLIMVLVVVTVAFGAASILKLAKDVEGSLSADGAGNDNNTNTSGDSGNTGGNDNTGNPGDTGSSGDTGSTDDNDNTAVTDLIEMCGSPEFGYDETEPENTDLYGIRFSAKISDYLKATVIDAGLGEMKWLYAPLDQIESAGLLNESSIDWVSRFEAAGVQYAIKDKLEHAFESKDDNNNWLATFRFVNVLYSNINRPMFAVMYLEHNDGTRQYATFPEGETVTTLSRSFGYVCVEALNQATLAAKSQKDLWPSEVDVGLAECISLSVGKTLNYANADAVPGILSYYPIFEADGTYGQNQKVDLTVGGDPYRYDVKTGVYGSDSKFIYCNMPFVCYTTNASVAVVENGCVKPVGTGTCKIWFHCGTGHCSIDVTVT